MGKITRTLDRVIRGTSDANIRFEDLRALLLHLGFAERVRGDHYIFTRDGVPDILNLQPRGSEAKAYQVEQVRGVIVGRRLADKPGEGSLATGPEAEEPGQSTLKEEENGQ